MNHGAHVLRLVVLAWTLILGLAIGSFLNVVIYRIPLGFRLTLPSRSACRTCKRRLSWAENIPVLSYILLKGRCRGCFTKIGGRYPLVELMTAALFVAVLLRCGMGFSSVYYCCFSALLVAVTFIDLDHRIIPDVISLPGMALGLIGGIWVSQIGFSFAATGAFFGGFGLWFTAWAYERATGREGLGLGDVKLIAMIGAFLGPFGALGTILVSSIFGSVIGIVIMAANRKQGDGLKTALPYGPFLAMGAITWLFWGDRIAAHFLVIG